MLAEALAAARAIEDEKNQTEALMALVPYLSNPLQGTVLSEALAAAQAIEDEKDRIETLVTLVPNLKQLPVAKLSIVWCETIDFLATRTRRNLLLNIQALAPIIETLGGKEAMDASAQAIIEVGKWFP